MILPARVMLGIVELKMKMLQGVVYLSWEYIEVLFQKLQLPPGDSLIDVVVVYDGVGVVGVGVVFDVDVAALFGEIVLFQLPRRSGDVLCRPLVILL